MTTNPHKSVCSWCNAVLREGIEPVSHGICEPCKRVLLRDPSALPYRHIPRPHAGPVWVSLRDCVTLACLVPGLLLNILGALEQSDAESYTGLALMVLSLVLREAIPWRKFNRRPRQ